MVYNTEVESILRSALDILERDPDFDRRLLDELRILLKEGRGADEREVSSLLMALEGGEAPQ